ncbi:Crp/Fnr family transcriptional regulator [Ferrimonas senticii]|uniref:Crp/Fnr family transcriptional regulator n=1 Tax=Ferrimonas senticii TaxID=394566 RepID=UPI0004017D8E|nr:Crp/Fnr family transcriptional regulator [Ferrimonas senticii]
MRLTPYPDTRFSEHLQKLYPALRSAIEACVVQSKTVKRGEPLLEQGQRVSQLVLVSQGKVSLHTSTINGRRFFLGEVRCNDDLFGEIEFLTADPCQWSVIAATEAEIRIIDANKLQQQLMQQPMLSLFFSAGLAVDYHESLAIYTSRLLHPIAYNIAFDLWQRHHNPGNLEACNNLEQEAERFGTSARAYRRALKTLTDEGIVEKSGRTLTVPCWQKLQQYLSRADVD